MKHADQVSRSKERSSRRLWPQVLGLTLAVLLLAGCGGAPAEPASTPTPGPPTSTPTPIPPTITPTPIYPFFTTSEVLEIPSISETVGDGVASFMEGEEPGMLRIEVNGTVPAVVGKVCLWCFETIEMAPNLNLPTEIFAEMSTDELASVQTQGSTEVHYALETVTIGGRDINVMKNPPEISEIRMYDVVLHIPLNVETSEFIVSGSEGAVLQKDGSGFRLIEGGAYLLQTVLP
ncbi:MAG: hypothetical protein WBB65_02620 [Anaerolineales bacterium]